MQKHTAEQSLLLNDTFTLWLLLITIVIITEVFVLCVKSLVAQQEHQIRKKTFWFQSQHSGDWLLRDQQTIVKKCEGKSPNKCFRNPENLPITTPSTPFSSGFLQCKLNIIPLILTEKKWAPLGHGKQNEIPALQNDNANDCFLIFTLGRGTHFKKRV